MSLSGSKVAYASQLGNISMLDIRPFLDLVEVHDFVRPTKSPQSIFPVPVFGNLWIPFDKFMDPLGNFIFHGVDNDISN